MTRGSLAGSLGVMVVMALIAEPLARADRLRCECGPGDLVLPAADATGVPRNTKLWSIGYGLGGRVELRENADKAFPVDPVILPSDRTSVARYDFGELASSRTYAVNPVSGAPGTRFSTGTALDRVAPSPPIIHALSIATTRATESTHDDVTAFDLDAAFDPDVVLVRLVIATATAQTTTVTIPGGWRWLGRPDCGTTLRFAPAEHVTVTITAIDLAGNESEPVTRDTVVIEGGPPLEPCGVVHHFKCGTGAIGIMFLGMILSVVAFVFLLGVIVKHFARVRSLGYAVAEPLSALVAERLARAAQRRSGLVAAVALVGVPAFFVGGNSFMSIIATIVGCIGLRGFFIASGILRMLDNQTAQAEALAHRLVVRVGEAETHLDLTEEKIAGARRKHAIPTSIARR